MIGALIQFNLSLCNIIIHFLHNILAWALISPSNFHCPPELQDNLLYAEYKKIDAIFVNQGKRLECIVVLAF